MALNLEKNRGSLLKAYNDVLDNNTKTDWALFSYEGQTNDLKVVGTGDGGIAEVMEDLNSGKIMYAFVRISDPKTSIKKNVLINWQGEGAPTTRKGACANHIRDVSKLLAGAHLTVTARTEDDIDEDKIIADLNLRGTVILAQETSFVDDAPRAPVGTVYNRVIPTKDINSSARDEFWRKEEEEERKRLEVEREKKRLEQARAEEERARQEAAIKEKTHALEDAQKRIETVNNQKNLSNTTAPVAEVPVSKLSGALSSPTRTVTDAEKMRQERNQEAKMLIGSRVLEAKALFSQNAVQTAAAVKAPVKPIRKINMTNPRAPVEPIPVTPLSNAPPHKEEAAVVPPPTPTTVTEDKQNAASVTESCEPRMAEEIHNEEDQFSTIKRSPHSAKTPSQEEDDPVVAMSTKATEPEVQLAAAPLTDEDQFPDDGGLKARALYDYQAADESEIRFDPGDIITHIDQIDEGWWQGLGPDGTYGLFPANYVELIN